MPVPSSGPMPFHPCPAPKAPSAAGRGVVVAGKRAGAAGLGVFVKHRLACRKMHGAGDATTGPDLAQPMGPTGYMTIQGLEKAIRDPRSVRVWPEQQMTGFDEALLPEADLDHLISYLAYMARRR